LDVVHFELKRALAGHFTCTILTHF
jgi:hypothetical protein